MADTKPALGGNVFIDTVKQMQELAKKHDEVCVAFSGGKDSLVVMDLCQKTFSRVHAFFMHLVPGLKCVEDPLHEATKRWPGLYIRQYPHWLTYKLMRQGIYCPTWYKHINSLPEIRLYDIYEWVMEDTGCELIITGAKKADSVWRKRNLKQVKKGVYNEIIYNPIEEWDKFDVIAYLTANKIPVPNSSGKNATGVDLSRAELLHMYDNHREDFEKVAIVFPYIWAVVKHREFYGDEQKEVSLGSPKRTINR